MIIVLIFITIILGLDLFFGIYSNFILTKKNILINEKILNLRLDEKKERDLRRLLEDNKLFQLELKKRELEIQLIEKQLKENV